MLLNHIYNSDCVEGMKENILSNTIDFVLTSPPYDNLRKYKGYSFDFESVANELYRVLKNGGTMVWVVSDSTVNGSESGTSFKQALYFKEIGFNLHDTMIYAKNNPMPLTHNRYEQQFEYMFVLTKGKPKTFNPILQLNKDYGLNKGGTFRHTGEETQPKHLNKVTKKESYRKNIWYYSVGKGGSTNDKIAFKHPAIFPEKLAEDHILSWSNEGDIVLDPFIGSGTTAKMSKLNNRHYIGFEISSDYCSVINERLNLI